MDQLSASLAAASTAAPPTRRNGVELSRQSSMHSCNRGTDQDFDQHGIWVDNGCRAEFMIGSSSNRYPTMSSAYPSNYSSTVVCDSQAPTTASISPIS
jgi:hypothetical protein